MFSPPLAISPSFLRSPGFASEELQHDKGLALLAVQSDGWAVQFVAPELCRDQEVVTLADFSGK